MKINEKVICKKSFLFYNKDKEYFIECVHNNYVHLTWLIWQEGTTKQTGHSIIDKEKLYKHFTNDTIERINKLHKLNSYQQV